MGFYFGNLTKKPSFSGKIKKDENYGIEGEISPEKRFLATISYKERFSGELIHRIAFGGSGGGLSFSDVVYRFVVVTAKILFRLKMKVIAARAITVNINSVIQEREEIPLSAVPAEIVTVDSKIEDSGGRAKLMAYLVAPVITICKNVFELFVGLIQASGAVAKYFEELPTEYESPAEAAPGSILWSRGNVIIWEDEGTGCSAPGQTIPAMEKVFVSDKTATACSAIVSNVECWGTQKSVVRCELITWAFPVYENGVLSVSQLFGGVQSGDTVEMDMETESAFWANAFNKDGVLSLVYAQTEPQAGNTLEVI